MMRRANRFSTIILLACCLAIGFSPVTVLATDQIATGTIIDSEPVDVVETDDGQTGDDATDRTEPGDTQEDLVPAGGSTEGVRETDRPLKLVLATESIVGSTSDERGSSDEATDPGDQPGAEEPPPVSTDRFGLVITQVQTRSQADAQMELIEIRNNSDQLIDITNWRLYYTSATVGTSWNVAEFMPSDSSPGWRLTISPGQYLVFVSDELAAALPDFVSTGVFTSPLANTGGRLLIADDKNLVQDGLAWGNAEPIPERGSPVPVSASGDVVIERKVDESGWHQDTSSNLADFVVKDQLRQDYLVGSVNEVFDACLNTEGIDELVPDGWYRDESSGDCSDEAVEPPNTCEGLIITEIGANVEDQFIEIYNNTDHDLPLSGCQLMTNRSSSSNYVFDKLTLGAGSYLALMIGDTDLRINKTTSSTVYIVSQDGSKEVDEVTYSNLKPDTSWARFGSEWEQTYEITPGKINQTKQYPDCEAGFFRNIETGRCNMIALEPKLTPCADDQFRNPETGRCKLLASSTSSLTPCKEGQFRNPETNRCKALTASTSSLQPCQPDQFRNPETNRCKKLASAASTLKPCQSGYERNPATNRCRKSTSLASIDQAAFPVQPIEDTAKGFVGWLALGGALLLGLGYAGWEWRHEIFRVVRRVKP